MIIMSEITRKILDIVSQCDKLKLILNDDWINEYTPYQYKRKAIKIKKLAKELKEMIEKYFEV